MNYQSSTNESAGAADAAPLSESRLMRGFATIMALPFVFLAVLFKIVFLASSDRTDSKAEPPKEKAVAPTVAVQIAPIVKAPELPIDSVGVFKKPFRAAVVHHVVQIGEAVVNFGIFTGEMPKMSRLLKARTERLSWQRARIAFRREVLTDFTQELATRERLPYSLEGAISYTRRELGAGISKAPARIDAATPRAAAAVDAEMDVSDDGRSSARPTVATGVVTSAGMVKVTPTGREAYRVFQIVVSEGANRAIFTGVDLLEKFNNNVFGMHDRIHIEKIKESFSVESGGKKKKREKNSYKIAVLEKAQS